MKIDRDFIHEIVNNFHGSIMLDGDLCDYSHFSPDNENYDDKIYQKIYALKYIPAYYFEYCVLAWELSERLMKNDIKNINISSFGCGLHPDYFALLHNLKNVKFDYHGYDTCQWTTRELLPPSNDNLYLHTVSASAITQDSINKTDVFIFPKSLGDIAENIDIKDFSARISNSKKNRVFFLNSFITVDHKLNNHHTEIFSLFHKEMLKKGFVTSDSNERTYYRGDHIYQGLKGIDYSFDYPQNIQLCEDVEKYDCKCRVVHNPVLTNSYMNYQILEYSR
ncbi:hypothetical protein HVZ46_05945 [Citrobacter freundii]|uniref:hypothetical protein n=1 Tax=Citrobacter freundii TaxID=546 RepID=UPI0015EA442A|nr:hypothetical protein [Citrobacter freundii]QMD24103.1 hypothetical protein HVZ46_05945 [Citrobacter freundii]